MKAKRGSCGHMRMNFRSHVSRHGKVVSYPPERIAFVGDDRVNDFEGATAAGLFPVLLDPDSTPGPGNRTIRSLTSLIDD